MKYYLKDLSKIDLSSELGRRALKERQRNNETGDGVGRATYLTTISPSTFLFASQRLLHSFDVFLTTRADILINISSCWNHIYIVYVQKWEWPCINACYWCMCTCCIGASAKKKKTSEKGRKGNNLTKWESKTEASSMLA